MRVIVIHLVLQMLFLFSNVLGIFTVTHALEFAGIHVFSLAVTLQVMEELPPSQQEI